jgi:hypothetical protein
MKTKEVQREKWPDFCQKLASEYRGSIITASQIPSSGAPQPLVERAPLETVEFSERTTECSDILHIRAGGVDHDIIEPIHIRLRNGGNDRYNQIEILAESGTVVIEMNPGLRDDL